MSKSKNTKNKHRNWKVPKNASAYFDPHYDDDFKAQHPVLYWLTVIAIIFLVCVGPFVFIVFCSQIQTQFDNPNLIIKIIELVILIIGFASSFAISIGVCNLFMILHKQYLGHWVTLISFAIGIFGSALSLLLLWII